MTPSEGYRVGNMVIPTRVVGWAVIAIGLLLFWYLVLWQPGATYENCDAARRAGAAPVYRGEPGYARHLDRDNDGIGCE